MQNCKDNVEFFRSTTNECLQTYLFISIHYSRTPVLICFLFICILYMRPEEKKQDIDKINLKGLCDKTV